MTLFDMDDPNLQTAGELVAKSDEFYTPKPIRELLPRIDLDPCAAPSQQLEAVTRFVGADGADGLNRSWNGPRRLGRVRVAFVNPPYNRRADGQSNLALWTARCRKAAEQGEVDVCIGLFPFRSSESYWHEHVFGVAEAVGLIRGRLRFENAAGVPLKDGGKFASVLVIWMTEKGTEKRMADAIDVIAEFANRSKHLVWWVDGMNQWSVLGEDER